ncbi:hypothetical protein Tco_0624951 [Tanacetum coccineum]|uniref:Uncharacterized protein n=1 Tax=Tanacetum coccineum TaxID=301880 RepID=A0ABQ4WFF2_9ASTR
MNSDIEERRHGPSDSMQNPSQSFKFLSTDLSHLSRRYTRYLLTSHSEIVDIELVNILSILKSVIVKMGNPALRPTFNKPLGNGNGNNGNQTQLLIAQKEEAGIQLQAEEFDLMAVAWDLDEIDVEQSGGTIEQHPTTVEETHALHLSSAKTITTLNEEIANLNNQLLKEKSTVSYLQQEKKKLKSDFKTREDELLDKKIQLKNKIKKLDNILVKTGQPIQTMHMLSPKPDLFYHTEQKMALGYLNPFYLKQA